MRSAPLISLYRLYTQQTAHIFSHRAHTQQAWIWAGVGWWTVPLRGYYLGVFHLDMSLVGNWHSPALQGPTLISHQGLTFIDRAFPVHFMSALHVLCSGPPERKNPIWQVYTKVQSKEGRSTALKVCVGWCFRLGQVWAETGFSPLVSPL